MNIRKTPAYYTSKNSKNRNHRTAYAVIDDFFLSMSPNYCRKYIFSMLVSACKNDYWNDSDPGSLLEFEEELNKLFRAAYILSEKGKGNALLKSNAILKKKTRQNQWDPSNYSGWPKYEAIWEYFPRHLSKKEFLNPYLVFNSVFLSRSLTCWLAHIRRIAINALSQLPDYPSSSFNPIETHCLMQKLVEAAFLVRMRTIPKSTFRPNADESPA